MKLCEPFSEKLDNLLPQIQMKIDENGDRQNKVQYSKEVNATNVPSQNVDQNRKANSKSSTLKGIDYNDLSSQSIDILTPLRVKENAPP